MNIFVGFGNVVTERTKDGSVIGPENLHALRLLRKLQKNHTIILNDSKAESVDDSLDLMVEYLTDRDVVIDTVMGKKIIPNEWDLKYALKSGDLFIDHMSFGIPLLKCTSFPKAGYMVDWLKIEEQLKQHRIIL